MPLDISQTKTRTLIFGSVFAAATVLSGNFAAAGAAGIAIQAIGGIAGNIGANDLGDWVKCFRQKQNILDDPHLTLAVGSAIGLVIFNIVECDDELPKLVENKGLSYPFDSLGKIAKNAETKWVKLSKKTISDNNYIDIHESHLVTMFANDVQNFHKIKALDIATWKEILRWLASESGVSLHEDVINYVAQKLYDEFPQRFRDVLKHNADNGGEAFAQMVLNLHGEALAALKEVLSGNQQIINALEEISTKEDNNTHNLLDLLKEIRELREEVKQERQEHSKTVNTSSFHQRIAEILSLLNYSNQEQEFKNAIKQYKESVFLVRAEEENIQRWLVWRLAKFIPGFKQAQKISIRIRSHPMKYDFDAFWNEFKQNSANNLNRESVIQNLAELCQTKSIIIAIYGLSYLDREKLDQFYSFWSDLVYKVNSNPRSFRSRLVLILAEKNCATVTNKLLPFTFVQSSSINHAQCSVSLKPLKQIFKNDVENWLEQDEVYDEINQTDDDIQSIICNDISGWEEEPFEILYVICYRIFQIDDGIDTIQNYWKLTG